MEIKIPYGKGYAKGKLPENLDVLVIDKEFNDIEKDEKTLLKEAMDNPIHSDRLENLIKKDDKVLIVINDHTRPGPTKIIVDEILERVYSKGLSKNQIKIIVATGSHRKTTKEELKSILGEEILQTHEIIVHDCMRDLDYIGDSKDGVPLYVNKALKESTFCITTGLIAPHHSAGYSGGRKSILPGLSGFETLKIHHSLPIRPFYPAIGDIYDNKFHYVALEAAKKVGVDYIVNAVQDPHKNNIAFVAGDLEEAHKVGVSISKKISEVKLKERADIVIVSPGGHPRDRNLYQSQKALSVAELLGKQDCIFILLSSSPEGIGEGATKEWLSEEKTPEDVVERFKKEGYSVGSNKAFMFARAMIKGKVIIVSDNLNKREIETMMFDFSYTLQEAIDKALKLKESPKVYVLPNAVNIIPVFEK